MAIKERGSEKRASIEFVFFLFSSHLWKSFGYQTCNVCSSMERKFFDIANVRCKRWERNQRVEEVKKVSKSNFRSRRKDNGIASLYTFVNTDITSED